MNLVTAFAVLAVKKSAVAVTQGAGPTGPPTDVTTSHYGNPQKIRVSWANGDASANTRIYMEQGVCPGSPPQDAVVNPGLTSYDSLFLHSNDPHRIQLSHYKNGQESAKTTCLQHGAQV